MRRLIAVVLLAGCSFPEPTVTDVVVGDSSVVDTGASDSSKPGDSLVTVDDGTETSGDSSVGETGDTGGDSAKPDAGDAGDTGIKMDTMVTGCEMPCDCDGDGDQAMRTGCIGMDCDDGDPRRNSKVTAFQPHSTAGLAHGGDWDCNGMALREFTADIKCNTYLSTTGCTQQGYRETAPACGTMATFVRCKNNGLACAEDTATSLVVKCK